MTLTLRVVPFSGDVRACDRKQTVPVPYSGRYVVNYHRLEEADQVFPFSRLQTGSCRIRWMSS